MNLLLLLFVINIWLQNCQPTVTPRKCMNKDEITNDCFKIQHNIKHKELKRDKTLDEIVKKDLFEPKFASIDPQPKEAIVSRYQDKINKAHPDNTGHRDQKQIFSNHVNIKSLLRKRGRGWKPTKPRPTPTRTRTTTRTRTRTTSKTKSTKKPESINNYSMELKQENKIEFNFDRKDSNENDDELKLTAISKMKEGPIVILLTQKKQT